MVNNSIDTIDSNQIEAQEQLIEDNLVDPGFMKRGEADVQYVSEDIFYIGTKDYMWFYLNKESKPYFVHVNIAENHFFRLSRLLAGYYVRIDNGSYDLHKIKSLNGISYPDSLLLLKDHDVNVKVEDIGLWKTDINAFNIWSDIAFFEIYFSFDSFKKPPIKKVTSSMIRSSLHIGAFRLKDIEFFIERGDIPESFINDRVKAKLGDILNDQVYDVRGRFKKVGDLFTIDELQGYFDRGIIDECKYTKYKAYLETVNEFDDMREVEEGVVIDGTKGELGDVK